VRQRICPDADIISRSQSGVFHLRHERNRPDIARIYRIYFTATSIPNPGPAPATGAGNGAAAAAAITSQESDATRQWLSSSQGSVFVCVPAVEPEQELVARTCQAARREAKQAWDATRCVGGWLYNTAKPNCSVGPL
jgi:hypothetical protein